MSDYTVSSLILDRNHYLERRAAERARSMAIRAARRIKVGDIVALEFENPDTLLYQVQEMLYAERVSDPQAAQHELDAYSRFLPQGNRLTATLFVELTDQSRVREELQRLRGVHHSVWLQIGESKVQGEEIPGPEEEGASAETYSVHFLGFELSPEQRQEFADKGKPVRIKIAHPEYTADALMPESTRDHLLDDLNQLS